MHNVTRTDIPRYILLRDNIPRNKIPRDTIFLVTMILVIMLLVITIFLLLVFDAMRVHVIIFLSKRFLMRT